MHCLGDRQTQSSHGLRKKSQNSLRKHRNSAAIPTTLRMNTVDAIVRVGPESAFAEAVAQGTI